MSASLMHPNGGDLLDFYHATASTYAAPAGKVECIKPSDFEDYYRNRHLQSFVQSMKAWNTYDTELMEATQSSVLEAFVIDLVSASTTCQKDLISQINHLRKKYRVAPSKAEIFKTYQHLYNTGEIYPSPDILEFSRKKKVRSNSGVLVITVLTSPGAFSCPKDCYYCPNEPGQPRSYLSTEPAVLRGNQNNWDAVKQFNDRANTLRRNGHIVDKIEILVLGGTWSGYPRNYQIEFIRDLFYAANVYGDPEPQREKLSLEEEQSINELTNCRIIGLTLETRPDYINRYELKLLRRFGCTRVQIGIQHVDDDVLKYINRGCSRKDCINAIRLLKNAAFKVDIHIMPDLPNSNPEKDLRMFDLILSSPEFQVDQWKIYPCEVTPFTKIEEWYKNGHYIPYSEVDGELLVELLIAVKSVIYPWIRLNRVIRDIPNPSIIAGNDRVNLRQIILDRMKQCGLRCKCIRCREVKDQRMEHWNAELKVRQYSSAGGEEVFLSYETKDERTIFGFLRLRLATEEFNFSECPFNVLKDAALLRELHIYGQVVPRNEKRIDADTRPQHSGMGSRLILAAEIIAVHRGFMKMAVIAGVGTREYYRKFGYTLAETYMVKDLSTSLSRDYALLNKQFPDVLMIQHVDVTSFKNTLAGDAESDGTHIETASCANSFDKSSLSRSTLHSGSSFSSMFPSAATQVEEIVVKSVLKSPEKLLTHCSSSSLASDSHTPYSGISAVEAASGVDTSVKSWLSNVTDYHRYALLVGGGCVAIGMFVLMRRWLR